MPKKPATSKPKPLFDLGLIPGTPAEQRRQASAILVRGGHPIAIEKAGSQYRVDVLGVPIGLAPTRAIACSAAAQVGQYRLQLGDFVYTYVKGWKGCDR